MIDFPDSLMYRICPRRNTFTEHKLCRIDSLNIINLDIVLNAKIKRFANALFVSASLCEVAAKSDELDKNEAGSRPKIKTIRLSALYNL